jgi:rhodanese-related sulfurtransferase
MTTSTAPTHRSVTPDELHRRLTADDAPMVLDVRTPGEFDTVHIRGSYNVPLDLLTEHTGELADHLPGHVVLVCQSGTRASQACQKLDAAGFGAAEVLDGGIAGYESAGGDVVRQGTRWDMNRQVRMAAGSLVLVGTLAGQLVHRRLGLLAGAIGAGLAYSAISDSCAMASVLARMPWNRVEADPSLASFFDQLPTALQDR